jgi:hypothetical protein
LPEPAFDPDGAFQRRLHDDGEFAFEPIVERRTGPVGDEDS